MACAVTSITSRFPAVALPTPLHLLPPRQVGVHQALEQLAMIADLEVYQFVNDWAQQAAPLHSHSQQLIRKLLDPFFSHRLGEHDIQLSAQVTMFLGVLAPVGKSITDGVDLDRQLFGVEEFFPVNVVQ